MNLACKLKLTNTVNSCFQVVLLLICSLVSTEAGYSANSFLNLVFRPAGRSRSFKWAGMGKSFTPTYIPPRPVYIPKWIPGPKPEYIARWVPNTPAPLTNGFKASQKVTDASYGFGAPKKATVVKDKKPLNAFTAAFKGQSKSDNLITALSKLQTPSNTGIIEIPKNQYSVTLGSSIRTPSGNANELEKLSNNLDDELALASTNYVTSIKNPTSFIGSPSNYNPQDIITANSMMFAGPTSNSILSSNLIKSNHNAEFSHPRQQDILKSVPQSLTSNIISAPLSQYSVTNIQHDLQQSQSQNNIVVASSDTDDKNEEQLFISDSDKINYIDVENKDKQNSHDIRKLKDNNFNKNGDSKIIKGKLISEDVDVQLPNIFQINQSKDIFSSGSETLRNSGDYREIIVGSSFQTNSHARNSGKSKSLTNPTNVIQTQNQHSNNVRTNPKYVNNNNKEDIVYIIDPKEKRYDQRTENINNSRYRQLRSREQEGEGVASITVVHPPAVAPPRSPVVPSRALRSHLNEHHQSPASVRGTTSGSSSFERRTNRYAGRPNGRRLFPSDSSHFRPSYERLIKRSRHAAPRSMWFF